MKSITESILLLSFIASLSAGTSQEARIEVQADQVLHPARAQSQ